MSQVKRKHTEQEHFGPFQDLISTLKSSTEIADLQELGSEFQILAP